MAKYIHIVSSAISQPKTVDSTNMQVSHLFQCGKSWFMNLSRWAKIILVIGVLLVIWFGGKKIMARSSPKTTYQTETATKGTLIVTVSASGTVSSANSASVTTQTSGVVSKIFVKNGQEVKSGDPIAEVDLDMDGKQRAAQALASYQGAKNALDNANTTMYTLQSSMFSQWKTFTDLAQTSTYTNADGSPNTNNRTLAPFISTNDDWLATEAKYKTQQNVIAQAQTSVNSAWASYQQASPTIYAPISGTISGLSLQIGSVLTAQTGSSGNSTAQRIANIKTVATPTAAVNLSQIDVSKVHINDKATMTMDAFPDKTYTGKVVSIDTTGSVSSGVTTYPAYIVFDVAGAGIYPNMAIEAKIITTVKNDVVLVPSAAVQTINGQTTVRIMKQGKVTSIDVAIGQSNDTQTEIVTGINDGDVIVTGATTTSTKSTSATTTSPFSALGGRGFGGGAGSGNVVRVGGR